MARARYVSLLSVLALHFGLAAVLIVASRIRIRSPAAPDLLTRLVLLPKLPVLSQRPVPPDSSRAAPARGPHLAPVVPVVPPLTPPAASITDPPADEARAPIDWQSEAQKAATALTRFKPLPSEPNDRRKTSSAPRGPRPWFPQSAHHAGEQYKTITGDSIVWISDKCYVKSPKPILGLPDLFARGMLSSTVCPGDSGKARGDLFEALPAYKKYHAGSAEPGGK